MSSERWRSWPRSRHPFRSLAKARTIRLLTVSKIEARPRSQPSHGLERSAESLRRQRRCELALRGLDALLRFRLESVTVRAGVLAPAGSTLRFSIGRKASNGVTSGMRLNNGERITSREGSRALRIMQLVQKPQRRGAEVFAEQLSTALRRAGHVVRTVYLYDFEGSGALEPRVGDVVLGGSDKHPTERIPGANPFLVRKLLKTIEAFEPDIVQLNGARAVKYGAIVRWLRPRSPWKIVYRNIGNPRDWQHGALKVRGLRMLMSAMDGVVALSGSSLDELRALYPKIGSSTVIPNGVDPDFAHAERGRSAVRVELDTPSRASVLIAVGSLGPEKRVDVLLEAFRLLRPAEANVFLWVVGQGPLRAPLETMAGELGVSLNVRFLGVRADVPTLMAAADIFVLTSDTEGIPAVVLEAGLQRLPVVATNVGAIPDCVSDGETGFLVAPGAPEGVADAIRVLLEDPDRARAMGDNGYTYVSERFTIHGISMQYVDFYRVLARTSA